METWTKPSGIASGKPSGTFRIPSGAQCFKPCREPSGFPSGNPSGTFRIPSGTQHFQHAWLFWKSLPRTNMETWTTPSGIASGSPSGTFRIPSGMQCLAPCRKPSGFPSGNPSGTFRIPSGMQHFKHAYFFWQKKAHAIISKTPHEIVVSGVFINPHIYTYIYIYIVFLLLCSWQCRIKDIVNYCI